MNPSPESPAQVALSDGGPITNMTLRDMFAAHALNGLLSNQTFGADEETKLACLSYRQADAMLAERAKNRTP